MYGMLPDRWLYSMYCICKGKLSYSFVMWASPKICNSILWKGLEFWTWCSITVHWVQFRYVYDLLRQLCMKSINQITARCTTQLAVNNTKYDLTLERRAISVLIWACSHWKDFRGQKVYSQITFSRDFSAVCSKVHICVGLYQFYHFLEVWLFGTAHG